MSSVLNDLCKGLLLIFLAILCNFLADTMNCSIQRTMYKNPLTKWLVVLGLIYFTINFTSTSNAHPTTMFLYSFFIFIIFIFFMKQGQITFYLAITILLTIFSLNQYLTYYQNLSTSHQEYQHIVKQLEKTILVLEILLLFLLFIGNMIYLRKQMHDYGNKFDWTLFYFGTNVCKDLKK